MRQMVRIVENGAIKKAVLVGFFGKKNEAFVEDQNGYNLRSLPKSAVTVLNETEPMKLKKIAGDRADNMPYAIIPAAATDE